MMPWLGGGLLAAGLIALLAALAGGLRRRERQRRQAALAALKTLRVLLERAQQHRGLRNVLLRGDAQLEPRVQRLRQDIEDSFRQLTPCAALLAGQPHWPAVQQAWGQIQRLGRDIDENLKCHNVLVNELLYLLEDLAWDSGLHSLPTGQAVGAIWRETLRAAECVGQARALGTLIASQGRCSGVEHIRLSFLRDKAEGSAALAFRELQGLSLGHSLERARQQLNALLALIDQQLLLNESVEVTADDYFSRATEALSALFALVDQVLHQLEPAAARAS